MNKNMNFIVNLGDRICATLESNGCRLASVNGVNFSSLDDVKSALLEMAGRFAGVAVLTVRNCTQGWRDVTALATMCRPATAMQSVTNSQPRIGHQYLIPWAS